MSAYYNEIDRKAAAWLRELIKRGLIAPGEVDERDIRDIKPSELKGFTQCHFFAGIGVWSYALRLAGWPDDRPVWTGSCPCQPFSTSGKRKGFTDERHLWPHWFHLIEQCKPQQIFGEQVASKDGLAWIDIVQSDLEGAGYSTGAVDLCAAGIGAPHIRQRLWFMANSEIINGRLPDEQRKEMLKPIGCGENSKLAHATGSGFSFRNTRESNQQTTVKRSERLCSTGIVGNSGCTGTWRNTGAAHCQETKVCRSRNTNGGELYYGSINPGPVNGFWGNAEWINCKDGKARAIEPGTFPLAHGAPERVGRIRGYGNAIVAQAAAAFIEASMSLIDTTNTNHGEWRDL